jgi:hypothetical protein
MEGKIVSAEKPHRDNTGIIFQKNPKWTAEKEGRPTHEGECSFVCPCCNVTSRKRIAGWRKQGPKVQFLAIAFSEPAKPKEKS